MLVGTSGGCDSTNASEIAFLQWDIYDSSGTTIHSSLMSLDLPVVNANGSFGLTLYKVADDSWGSNLTWATRPTLGDIIETRTVQTSDTSVTFGADYSSASTLATYLQSQAIASDGTASFALAITACTDTGKSDSWNTIGITESENGTSGGNPSVTDPGTAPFLALFNPTAITLSSLSASGPITPYALLAAVIGLAALALLWIRRR